MLGISSFQLHHSKISFEVAPLLIGRGWQGRRKHLKVGERHFKDTFFLTRKEAFPKHKKPLPCLLQNLRGHVPPVPPRFLRLCVIHFSRDPRVQSSLWKVPVACAQPGCSRAAHTRRLKFLARFDAFGEVSLDPIDHQQRAMEKKQKTRFITF